VIYWYPTMNGWGDQTGIAHRITDDGKPSCGVLLVRATLGGGGIPDPYDMNCHPCRRCTKLGDTPNDLTRNVRARQRRLYEELYALTPETPP